MKKLGVAGFLLLACTITIDAQQPKAKEPPSTRSEIEDRLKTLIEDPPDTSKKTEPSDTETRSKNRVPVVPEATGLKELDASTKERYFAALQGYYAYRIFGYDHRKEVFRWQLYSSKITFIVMIILVMTGIYFSGVQFHRSLRQPRPKQAKSDEEAVETIVAEKDERTEVVATIKGIKVSSPILGVIILIISFLFFYLYLVHIYPIHEVL